MDDKKRLSELALRASFTGRAQFTHFLEPAAERDALSAAHAAGAQVRFFGGYDGAERRVAAFYAEVPPEDGEYPVAALALRWNARFASAQHRDLLGAAMGLGLERGALGDVALSSRPGEAYLFCLNEIAAYIAANLESAGRAKLTVSPAKSVDAAEPEGTELRVTVQSLRLDAVLAAGYNLSRAEAQKLIAAGLVKLNHAPELRGDAKLEAGSLLSVRGYGRLRVDEIQGESRRGRTVLKLFRYGK